MYLIKKENVKLFIMLNEVLQKEAPQEGIEPSTTSLKGWRSTAELSRLAVFIILIPTHNYDMIVIKYSYIHII